MSSWLFTSYDKNQLNILPTNGPRLVRQNAFILDPANPGDPFEPNTVSPSDDSSISSFSSLPSPSSSFLVENDTDRLQQQKPFERIPLPENTADNDRLENIPQPLDYRPDKVLLVLWSIFLVMLSIWSCQVLSCISIKHLSTERMSVDPDGPSYVYIPVFQWTCWRQTWMGMYYTSALWIIGIAIVFYWLYLERR